MTGPGFVLGDVVVDKDAPDVLCVVTEVRERSMTVVSERGARFGGPGLLNVMRHREPRVRVEVPPGAMGNRGWNREQAVTATLRRAGLR